MLKKKPFDYSLTGCTNCRVDVITQDIQNNEPLVIGNYWIKKINPAVNLTIDELKIYDYERSSMQIYYDFLRDLHR
ncbi:hypothetical protein NUZ5A_20237 [Candidatus Nitrosotenuis uzonensis]|uniref:Uncharacterized protein n=1 Tax=Candidatus Nitrosotenuis uzonensis TaxID=1407055 RepID=A0A812F436_9ARCH|nr:hypothetical protein NUZ5A_20237 [Candidatus Nitrosotenuis uzonensis]